MEWNLERRVATTFGDALGMQEMGQICHINQISSNKAIKIHNGSAEGVEMYLHHRGLNIQESSWMRKEMLLCVFS